MSLRTSSLIYPLLIALALGGFGCKKDAAVPTLETRPDFIQGTLDSLPTTPPPTPHVTSTRADVPADWPDDLPPPQIILLQRATYNLSLAKSFKASLHMPLGDKAVDGDLEFDQQNGLHGILHLPDGASSELFVKDDEILFRSNTSTWQDYSQNAEGQQMADVFRQALSFRQSTSTPLVRDAARLLKTEPHASGCQLYVIEQYDPEASERENFQICLANDLPSFIIRDAGGLTTEIHYRDFNQPMPIQRPVMNK